MTAAAATGSNITTSTGIVLHAGTQWDEIVSHTIVDALTKIQLFFS